MWRGWFEEVGAEEFYPAFGGLAVDSEGTIWIGEYPGLGDSERRWTLIGSDGRPMARLELPLYRPEWLDVETAIRGYAFHEILDVTPDRIVLLRTDELDVQYVEVLQIRR
jgi:hypothetical protein